MAKHHIDAEVVDALKQLPVEQQEQLIEMDYAGVRRPSPYLLARIRELEGGDKGKGKGKSNDTGKNMVAEAKSRPSSSSRPTAASNAAQESTEARVTKRHRVNKAPSTLAHGLRFLYRGR